MVLGDLGEVLAHSCGLLGRSWGLLGRFWAVLGAQLGRCWVVLGDLGGVSGWTWSLWGCSLLVFGDFKLQNKYFQKSVPGVGGGTILVVLEGS